MAEWRRAFRHPVQTIDEAIIRAQTCPDCGCKPGQWREDCDCARHDCECADSFRGPDTDFDDTFDYVPPDGPAEPARGKWWLRGKCSYACAGPNCPPYGPCQREERFEADRLPPASFAWLTGPPPVGEDRAMPAHIPAGREDLWRRQEEADAEVRRLTALYEAAERRADHLNRIYPAYSPQVRAADAETERINTEVDRAEAVAERVHQERTAGLSSWIDHDPTAPICSECGGTGGPPGSDAHSACKTCRGWGREDDGRPPIPVWSDKSQKWINPATGQSVDLLAEPPAAPDTSAPPDAASPPAAQGATDMKVPGRDATNNILDRWDQFLEWLFKGWGFDDTKHWAPERPNSPRNISKRVDVKRAEVKAEAERKAAESAPDVPAAEPESAPEQPDTRPQPEPQNLDALASAPTPPHTSARFRRPPPMPLRAWRNVNRDWCSCEGNAHDARCRFANVRSLNVAFPSPSGGGSASTEPEPSNNQP